MKKRVLTAISLGAMLSISAIPFMLAREYVPIEGYSTNKLPTTIYLNDPAEENIRGYYNALTSLESSELTGTNLLKNLKPILKNGQKYYKYDGGNLWAMYEITDRDWEKSPASSTVYGTYNAATNMITNYEYGSSASNSKNNPFLHQLYINRDVDNLTRAWVNDGKSEASHGNNKEWYIDQEHIWQKSQGFNDTGSGGARGDPMHLWAGDSYVNSALHSDNFYGYVDKNKKYTDGAAKYSEVSGNLLGKSKTIPTSSSSVFEPQDSDKGDIARALFYMVARYNYLSGSDLDGINSDNPNLELVQSADKSSSYTSSTTVTGKIGILSDLLEWNRLDPPDEWEIHRNNLLYTNFTNNRNPFIDFPSWADLIWGEKKGTTSANPQTDSLNDFEDPGAIHVTGVSLDKSSLSLDVYNNKSATLVATIEPSDATNKKVTWTSSNSTVASVSTEGVVTAKKEGTATITVKTKDRGFTATCDVTVTDSTPVTLSSIIVETLPDKLEYRVGDSLDKTGMIVNAIFSNSDIEDVTSEVSVSPSKFEEAGEVTVTVSYTFEGVTKTAKFDVTVKPKLVFGCFGDVTSTSIILSSLALVGVISIAISYFYKKKKQH